jgi:isopentenyl-diphosphate Delta-isomerase
METDRKLDHINLALSSQVEPIKVDGRFNYEPAIGTHSNEIEFEFELAGKKLKYPIWISSMTGGTPLAKKINENLAKVCKEFGLGMGLGSCRSILENDDHIAEFDVRDVIGDDLPLYANLGIAQVEMLLENNKVHLIENLVKKLKADGLIIHINPFQEWMQPEGNKINRTPIDTISRLIDDLETPIIVKEVGQGMGPESLKSLMQLPIEAIEFGAFGGTNFSLVELQRNETERQAFYNSLTQIGHTAEEMVDMINKIRQGKTVNCNKLIVSGGIRNFLDGYYLINKSTTPAIYAQASSFLKYAKKNYDELHQYVESQIQGLELAYSFLRIKED